MLSRSGRRFTGYEDPTQHDAIAGGPAAATAARYQPGAWERAGDALRVHHGDQIGTSRFMTGASAQTLRRAVYTAFGELVLADDGNGQPAAASRYGYAGAWGYETGLEDAGEPDLPPLPFIHVGERWYDPASGRFLQRDPIGIDGGLNAFLYVEGNPAEDADPEGLKVEIETSPPIVLWDQGVVIVHYYEIETSFIKGKYSKYLGRRCYPLNGLTPKGQFDPSGMEEHVNNAIVNKTKADAGAVGAAHEHGNRARNLSRDWIKAGRRLAR